MKKVCSIYRSPVGLITIVNDGFYITNILYDNHSCDFYFDQNNAINKRVMLELDEYFKGVRKTFDLPLKFEGTDFQKKVWNALTKIPYGETRSYGDIADDIGKPTAVRAIGMANARNPIAIVVPCHRVVNANGSLAGYNGGIHIKKKLLELEKSTITAINQKLISQNKASSELLNIALQSTDIYEFYYYPNEDFLMFPERTAKTYSLPTKFENGIQNFFNDFVFPQDKETYFNMYNKIIINGERTASAIYRNKDATKWLKVILSSAEYDKNNNPLTVVGIFVDITEPKQLELETNNLINMHKEVLSSINNMFIGIHRLDLINGTIRSIKTIPYFEDFNLNVDYNFDYWLDSLSKYYHPNDREKFCYQYSIRNIIKHRDLGESNFQGTYRRFNGSTYSWISNNIIINNKNFSKDVAIIVQIDVSDNYQKSNIIHALGNEYYCLYYINLDLDTYEILRSEETVKNTLKLSPEGCYSTIMKEYIKHFVHPDDTVELDKFTSIINLRSSLNSENNTVSCTFRKKISNHYEWVKIKFILSKLDNHNFVTLAMKNVDEKVREELNKKQFLQYTLNKAEIASQAKSKFLSKISHDIRNPMVSIMGLTTIAKTNINNPEYIKSCLEQISTSSQELLSLINSMLDMSQIETGDFNLILDEFSFSKFIQSTLDLNFKHFNEKGIDFVCTVENISIDNVIGDKAKLQQLLSNLLSNAFNYTNFGGKVSLTIKELAISNDNIITYKFIIKDNGIGIKQSELKKIFQPFIRSDDIRVQNLSGSGLGLTIASNIATLMNGQITVNSIINDGSTFTATLNLSANEKPITIQRTIMNEIKVIVVNSNEVELKNICNSLNSIGINSVPMYLGKDIVTEILFQHQNSNDYFAIIIDKNVSDINYLELIKNIYAYMGNKTIKIFVSSYDCNPNDNDKLSYYVDEFIPKPIFNFQLYKIFNDLNKNFYTDNPFETKPLKNTKCLLIDNDTVHKQINQEILKMVGSNVDTIDSDYESITHSISHTQYDYIIFDVDTNTNLKDTFNTIKIMNNNIPIIAITSYCSELDFERLISLGANSHLVKPIDTNIKSLINIIINNIS